MTTLCELDGCGNDAFWCFTERTVGLSSICEGKHGRNLYLIPDNTQKFYICEKCTEPGERRGANEYEQRDTYTGELYKYIEYHHKEKIN